MTSSQKRKQKLDRIGIVIIALCATPMIMILIIGAALSMAGCASPDVVCTFDWGVRP